MSTPPVTCPACGEDLGRMASVEGHLRHECPGPRVDRLADQVYQRVVQILRLDDEPSDPARIKARIRAWRKEHEETAGG